jgi:hypothetical protein
MSRSRTQTYVTPTPAGTITKAYGLKEKVP